MLFAKQRNTNRIRLQKSFVTVSGLQVEVWHKAVKRITLVVYREDGRVRISVPFTTPDSLVEATIRGRMAWIKRQQEKFRAHEPALEHRYITGEMHSFAGKHYPLFVAEALGHQHVQFDPSHGISLSIKPGSSVVQRQKLLRGWYRTQILLRARDLLEKWQPKVGEDVAELRIKRMKTRWGTCNIRKRRIWLNLELMKKPESCLEYILVHEMVHLLEPGHGRKFYSHLDRLLPGWRDIDLLLK